MIALGKSFRMYMYLSDRLHDREDIAKMVIAEDEELLRYASERLKNDTAFIESVVSLNTNVLEYVSDALKKNLDFVKAIFVHTPVILSYVPARWLKDKEIILDILSNGTVQTDKFSILKMLSKKLVDDEEVVAAACVANSGMELKFASDRLQYCIEFVLNLLMSYDIDLNDCLHEEIARDEEVAIYLKKWDVRKRFNV